MIYLNLSAYKFVTLESTTLPLLQHTLKENALDHEIKGTILLSTEGINLFLAGKPESLHLFIKCIQEIPAFSDIWFKFSESDFIPFKRMLVRIKKEIITMNRPEIEPEKATAPYLEPEQLKEWYAQHKDIVILDTRNNYEVDAGTFDQAIHCNIENFSDFPQAVEQLPDSLKTKPIITFCTGGIRCEKAAAYLLTQGFQNVWQLKGGVLNYFEQCGGAYFNGECFVFDDRSTVGSSVAAQLS